ncbi:PepSY-associated TM helix domain-containing protein [Paraburkholderia sp. BCC1885]|uniref:PepSY-associated TM helix domain-containing protein n=1 Tax=Paraburkholderia sp. BCC1885 TaxID=2562669 RepID=UPI00118455F4|nr:PepSY-associated TM helix domain-containing protein [Paraburkholderia sp. BCC1885]
MATTLENNADQAASQGKEPKSRSRRSTFLKWLRKVHGWVGLWGAVLGLLFGVTGILQNHRATLKIKVGGPDVSTIQVAVPTPPPRSPRELAKYLQAQLKLDRPAERVSREAAKPVTWGDQSVIQPEHWTIRFIAPSYLVTADMWKGGNFVNVERRDQGLINTIEGLHRSEGAGVGWILFADSIAGSLILLSLTGVLLWTELNRRKTIGASIFVVSLITMLVLALQSA